MRATHRLHGCSVGRYTCRRHFYYCTAVNRRLARVHADTLMKIFIDTADSARIKAILDTGVAYGTTTNPAILQASGLGLADVPALVSTWRGYGAREMGFQATGVDTATIVANGEFIASQGDDVFVKIPATVNGFTAAAQLIGAGASVLITAVFSVSQVVMAAAVGARYVSPYLGPLDSISADGLATNMKMQKVLQHSATDMLAAGIASASEMAALAVAGVDTMTAPPDVIVAAMTSPATTTAVARFEEAVRA